jgi:dimethylargininase
MAKTIAFVRSPGPSFNQAISSNLKNQPIDIKRACLQHESYIAALKETGLDVISLPSADEYPDAPFVEDTTVVFDHIALACPNKEKSRRGEGPSIHKEIKKHITIKSLPPSVTLDGGDVLNTEEKIFVGISSRTNLTAVNSLAKFTTKPVIPVKVIRGLHLKTSVSYLGNNIIVLDPSSIETTSLRTFKWIETSGYAANCLAIGNIVLISKGCTEEADKIRLKGFKTLQVDISEFEKADGGLTCLSIILKKNNLQK